ncbi:MAG: zinc ribbon domain-containing protein, partial [Asgard group archaeon]|nr:zinc ribbon domain-containing protein [Asgard group archaeon]
MVKYCSRCGARAIPGAKFCRSCGNKLEKKDKKPVVKDTEEKFEEEIVEEFDPEPSPVKVELTKEEEESLLILSDIIPLQKKIEELNKEKDTLEIRFRVEEEITEKEYNTESKKLGSDITKFTKEIEEKR